MTLHSVRPLGVVCVLLASTVLALAGSASAAPVIDQEQPVIDTAVGFVIGIGGASEQKLAQVITPGLTGLMTEVRLSAACQTTLTVEVQGVSAGVPNGVVLGRQSVPFSGAFPTTFRGVPFSTPVPVTAGVPYALVLTTPDSCGIWPGPVGNPYPGGDAFFDSRPNTPGIWVPLSLGNGREDLPFQTLVDAVVVDRTAPEASCAARDVPAGARGQQAAGFFQLLGSDNMGVKSIVVKDSASNFVSMPFTSGDHVKITQAPGAAASEIRPGPRGTVSHLTLKGDAILRVTDTSDIVTDVPCEVPPASG